jgi:signal transduction histidine kinase
MSHDPRKIEEREHTNQSLRSERDASDAGSRRELPPAETSLDSERAADELRDTQVQENDAIEGTGSSSRPGARLAESRARGDASLRVERALADELLDPREEEYARANAKLLVLERQRTDADLLTERARSDEALANRDDFLGIVSHDLRNLIYGITLTAELTATHSVDDPEWRTAVEGAKQIQSYAARMSRLVRDLQDVASIDSGNLQISPARRDSTSLITEIVDSFRPTAAAKHIVLESTVSGPALAQFDHDRMMQVLSNLLTNAIKFTSEGGSVQLSRDREAGMLRFTVKDTGVGINPDHVDAIFERFWQVGKGDRRGFGLGLYIAKCIVEAHGGAIWANPERRKGSEIVFTLPAA